MKTSGNLKRVCEGLSKWAFEFKNDLSDIKVEEGYLKVLNDMFAVNVEHLQMALKFVQLEFQGETNQSGVTAAIEEPSVAPQPDE